MDSIEAGLREAAALHIDHENEVAKYRQRIAELEEENALLEHNSNVLRGMLRQVAIDVSSLCEYLNGQHD